MALGAELLGVQGDQVTWQEVLYRPVLPLATAVHKHLGPTEDGKRVVLQHHEMVCSCCMPSEPEALKPWLVLTVQKPKVKLAKSNKGRQTYAGCDIIKLTT